ncbi:STAS domain-containing protein [Streptomyces sp. NPDC102360]|uniref:STAS domain-containing protein n=1 Tax=Streptomyces sp. NPDC102360 TaxID=3366160 RepID=UPI00382BAE75
MGNDDVPAPDDRLTIHDRAAADGRHILLHLHGELDYATVPALCDAVTDLMGHGRWRQLVLDLSAVTWCDNASLYSLLGIRSALQRAGGSLTLAEPSPAVLRAIERTGLDPRLHVEQQTIEYPPPAPAE